MTESVGRLIVTEKEYIEREALPQKKERGFFLDDDFNAGWNACLDKISVIPAADVRPVVRGEWIWKKSGEVVCSRCNMKNYLLNLKPQKIINLNY